MVQDFGSRLQEIREFADASFWVFSAGSAHFFMDHLLRVGLDVCEHPPRQRPVFWDLCRLG